MKIKLLMVTTVFVRMSFDNKRQNLVHGMVKRFRRVSDYQRPRNVSFSAAELAGCCPVAGNIQYPLVNRSMRFRKLRYYFCCGHCETCHGFYCRRTRTFYLRFIVYCLESRRRTSSVGSSFSHILTSKTRT